MASKFIKPAFPIFNRFGFGSISLTARNCSTGDYSFKTLKVESPKEFVYHVELNRPDKLNAMNETLWREIGICFNKLADDSNCRSVVLSGAGKLFTAGLDFNGMGQLFGKLSQEEDAARKAKILKAEIRAFQDSFTAIEKCQKPVIAAIHGACIGGGVDMICACDVRYCTKDAYFQIKEVDLGLAADVGTLQRLPKIVGNDSLVRELAFSARAFKSTEALQIGLVSGIFDDQKSMSAAALDLATLIASKSPVAVQGTKVNLNYSRNHTTDESLEYMAHWNMLMLQSEDLVTAASNIMSKSDSPPVFSKL